MTDDTPKPELPRPERLIEEGRSASAVALGFLNDVKTGAGVTTGAVIVGGIAHQAKQYLPKHLPNLENDSEKKEAG